MHTRASNSELVEPLPEPERTLNRRLRQQNRRVPFEQKNNPPQHPRVVNVPILNINYFRHFLVTLQNLYPMDDEPMWVADCVFALTTSSAIIIPETASEFAIKVAFVSDESSAIVQNKVPPKLRDPRSFLIPCNFNKAFLCNALADLGASINLMPYSFYAKLYLVTLKPTKISVRLAHRSFQYPVGIAKNMLVEVGKFTFPADFVILEMEEDSKVPLFLGRPFLHTADAVIRVKQKQLNLRVGTERMIFHIDSAMKPIQMMIHVLVLTHFPKVHAAIFHDMIEESVEVFMDDFSIFGSSFDHCLNNLDKMLQRCKDAHLVLSWEKCHFMVKEGIVLGHKVSKAGLEVDKAKTEVISKLPPPLISKTIVHTDHSALRKGTENFAADHLSRIKNDETSDDSKVDDNFPREALMEINTEDES
nr:reverse transcriptase domain-containing protein [Tanacetum cinerariifolium]